MFALAAIVAFAAPMWIGPGTPVVVAPEGAAGPLPERREDIVILGDSITAGVHLMALDDDLAARSWANRLLLSFGMEPDLPRLPSAAPVDFPALVRDGWGFEAWRYVASALPWALGGGPRFEAGEPRTILAVPGQTVGEVLHQSSRRPGRGSTGWILGRLLLPENVTAIEAVELADGSPTWAVLWIGTNDLLSSFGIVGAAVPPEPAEFARDYEALARRVAARLAPGTPPSHLLLGTLPDVTRIPLWQPLPPGARDERGEPWPEGSVASAFLVAFRDDRFRRGVEAFSPAALDSIRARGTAYNSAIRSIAERHGYSVLDLAALMEELECAPDWGEPDSPWFSPDLHHPAAPAHREIARHVEARMREIAGVDREAGPSPGRAAAPAPPATGDAGSPAAPAAPDPVPLDNARLDRHQRARAIALMRGATLASGQAYPPRPTVRLSLELAAQAGSGRLADGAASIQLALERPALPANPRWNSRGFLAGRLSAILEDGPEVPVSGVEARLGWSLEPMGAWHWQRWEAGARWVSGLGAGWWLRSEWRPLFAEVSADGWTANRIEAGVRWGTDSRPGHHGN